MIFIFYWINFVNIPIETVIRTLQNGEKISPNEPKYTG